MANPLAIALALYGGYKGYKAGKERGGGIKSVIGAVLGAAGGYYGGQALGSAAGLQNVAGTQNFTNAMMSPFKAGQAATSANAARGLGGEEFARQTYAQQLADIQNQKNIFKKV